MSEASQNTSIVPPHPIQQGASQPKRTKLIVIGAVLLVVAAVVVVVLAGGGGGEGEELPSARVARGTMLVSITESGEVKAGKRKVISNDLNWSVDIVELAPQGALVQKGDTIIRLECEDLMVAITDQELLLQSAEDANLVATKQVLLTKKEMAAQVSKAKTAVVDAENDLKKYVEGEWDQQRDEAEANIKITKGDLILAEGKLDSKLKINRDPALNEPYSKSEIEAEELSVERLKLALKKAETAKGLLLKYTHPRTLRDLKIAISDAILDLEITEVDADTKNRLADAAKKSADVRLAKRKARLKELKEDAAKLHVVAEEAGLVVHETRRRHWSRPITLAVGEKINPRQQLMIIPDMTTLQVETTVYEAVRDQVYEGLPALIRLTRQEAKNNTVLTGMVYKVAPLPDSQNPWLSPGVKVFPTVVKFTDLKLTEGLTPGMTAQVEIILAELPDVLSVPIAAVFSEAEETYCYKTEHGKHSRVPVRIGRSSETQVQILSGLAENDLVLLAPPPGAKPTKKAKERPKTPAIATRPATTRPAPTATRPASGSRGEGGRRGGGRSGRGSRGMR